ncbi:MAG: hypothetical protein WBG11_01095 [Methylocella sp.]
MAHFTKDRTIISHPSCLELDKGACPVKNRAGAAPPGERQNQQPPLREKSTINPLSFGLSATFGPGAAICLALAIAPKRLYSLRFCC